eukprot:m.75573 g.75573  ORF g.75573 m.75573 type:complete len:315 (+) comp8486_c0_seq10:20-964(+)
MVDESKKIKGILPALVTPFLEGGDGVDVDAVEKLVEFHLETGVHGFYLCGSTGEGVHCSVSERKTMVEAVFSSMEKFGRKLPVIVMVTAHSVKDSISLAQHAEEQGAHAISTIVPIDNPNNLEVAVEFWKQIGESVQIPLYVYWIAHTADKTATASSFLQAMATVPNFKGLKFTDTNFYMFEQLVTLSKGTLNCFTGPDEMMGAGLFMGSDGAIGSTYNVHPKLAVRIYDEFQAGNVKTAMKLQVAMNKNIEILIRRCDCASKGTNIIAGLKCIYKRKYGIDVHLPKPASALQFTEEDEDALMNEMEKEGCIFE